MIKSITVNVINNNTKIPIIIHCCNINKHSKYQAKRLSIINHK